MGMAVAWALLLAWAVDGGARSVDNLGAAKAGE